MTHHVVRGRGLRGSHVGVDAVAKSLSWGRSVGGVGVVHGAAVLGGAVLDRSAHRRRLGELLQTEEREMRVQSEKT